MIWRLLVDSFVSVTLRLSMSDDDDQPWLSHCCPTFRNRCPAATGLSEHCVSIFTWQLGVAAGKGMQASDLSSNYSDESPTFAIFREHPASRTLGWHMNGHP